nr:integrase, catalytic region, zinc finger, CCHC-type, peptidase aspartic, catalytic [Tanacetum cinerariifolium]
MSRDVITVDSTMRISFLYRGEYSQWHERFMDYLEEKMDGETMINSTHNGDQPLPVSAPVSLARTTHNAPPTLKDPNNETAKDLWDAPERQMRGFEYGEQDRKSAILYEYETFKAIEGEQLLDTYLHYLQVINDLKKCGYKKDNYPLALIAQKTKVGKQKEKVVVSSDSKGSGADNISELKKITGLLEGHFAKDCKKEKVKDYNYYKTKMLLAKKDSDKQVLLAEDQAWMESNSDSDQEINANMVFIAQIEKVLLDLDESSSSAKETIAEKNNEFNEQMKVLNEKNAELLAQMEVLQNQLKVKHVVIDTHTECQAQYVKLEEERYEYMIRYSALYDNDKQHMKKINEQEILFDKMSHQDVEIDKCLQRLNECENKLHKIKQTNQTIHMIMPSKDTLYNGRKRIGFENPSYFEKAKDLRPSLYDEKDISLGYTSMFLIHSDEALEIEKFKRARENKIEFAYNYGNLNAIYVNEKINFSDDYFQEIINLDFEKIDSPFQQTSSLKPYVLTVILEKIIIDLEDEDVSLLEKQKENLKTIESLKLKGFELSENVISKSENQSENDCQVVEKECDNMENPKVIAPGMLNLDTFSSVRRPKQSSVIWKKKGSSNTSNVDLSSVSHLKLNKDVKRYSRKDLLSCNNSHPEETSSAYVCNDAMNVSCNSRLCDFFDENHLFIFDDESIRISPVSKMPFRKKPHDYMNIIDSRCSKHMTGNRALLTNFVKKFLGTVRFGNNNFTVIAGYGDGLKVAFRKSTCFVRNEDGVYLLTSDRSSNLYTIALNEVASNSSNCLLAKASSS